MIEWFDSSEFMWAVGVGAAALTTLVQKLSHRYKPWTWIAKQLGNAVNRDLIDKLDGLEKKVDKLEKIDKRQDREHAEEKAIETRRRIIRFADECRRGEKHSEEYFNNVLEDISNYKDYCTNHPEFENEKAVMAIHYIDDTYRHCYEENSFL